MWGDERANLLLAEVRGKNAFINFDTDIKTYQFHNIFTGFLRELLEKKDSGYKRALYEKAGHWCVETGDRLTAMQYFYEAGDFENLLCTAEADRARSFSNENKELIIKYFEQCPPEYKKRHPVALLVYAMALMTFNEMSLFQKTCSELALLIQDSSMDAESIDALTGELELLLSFTRYNDIMGMSEHHKRACALLKKPSVFMDTTGSWTFGSPSVLYMFYRESGELEQEVRDMKEAMPYYYKLTDGHGTGAEYLMEAEWYFNKGDFENAEIAVHQALYLAGDANQPNMILCALFLKARMALMRGDYTRVLDLSWKIHEAVEKRRYILIHTVDMCKGFIDACLQQRSKIPGWLAEGDFSSSRLFFPARAFYNIIYGRALLLNGDYLKLLGISGQFIGIASVFHASGGSGDGEISFAVKSGTSVIVDAVSGEVTTVGTGESIITVTKAGTDIYEPISTEVTVNVAAKSLSISGATVKDKEYDGTVAAEVTGINLSGIVGVDVVTAGATAAFKDANAGVDKAVDLSDVTLSGDDAGKYTIAQTAENITTATIMPAEPKVQLSASPATGALYRSTVSLAASITSIAGGTTPSGSVTFYCGSNELGTVPCTGGEAVYEWNNVPIGTYGLSAVYSGDANYSKATGTIAGYTVIKKEKKQKIK
jgi:hypothetical protein